MAACLPPSLPAQDRWRRRRTRIGHYRCSRTCLLGFSGPLPMVRGLGWPELSASGSCGVGSLWRFGWRLVWASGGPAPSMSGHTALRAEYVRSHCTALTSLLIIPPTRAPRLLSEDKVTYGHTTCVRYNLVWTCASPPATPPAGYTPRCALLFESM